MSLRNVISFGEYTPPAPTSISNSSPDTVKDFNMANGDITRFLIRHEVETITAQFQLTDAQLEEFKRNVHKGSELAVTYRGKDMHMLLASFNDNVLGTQQKGYNVVSITLKESRR